MATTLRRLGATVRVRRIAAGLTQEGAADLARLDGKHLQAIERGRANATVATLVGIARALRCHLADLFRDA